MAPWSSGALGDIWMVEGSSSQEGVCNSPGAFGAPGHIWSSPPLSGSGPPSDSFLQEEPNFRAVLTEGSQDPTNIYLLGSQFHLPFNLWKERWTACVSLNMKCPSLTDTSKVMHCDQSNLFHFPLATASGVSFNCSSAYIHARHWPCCKRYGEYLGLDSGGSSGPGILNHSHTLKIS